MGQAVHDRPLEVARAIHVDRGALAEGRAGSRRHLLLGAHVRIMEGPLLDECASVRNLVFLADGPRYRVEVDAAHIELEFPQPALASP